jgi:hypothetical protein
MPREIKDADGTTWTCVQAFAGLGKDAEKTEAARVEGTRDCFHVVCTPSGGAKSVRVELPGNWEKDLPDEEVLRAIKAQQEQEAHGPDRA